ncbi:epidermal growth factor receptor substrate 15-like 1 [Pyrus ussuriensis x Pyrus communis]|uniref:Epidermal growth factor receptor substrate 15-like 1 n=1 Tax=Pyrus ussuriensis x Pyrus communis TaxID=2448454 RepID=A0A5N5HA47_9ROSA|nr:epidermal growth factor receptor substrate 15-like 1 [Pyrus ussuriensis x Pyrus communis]
MRIFDEPVWNAMARLVAMKQSLSSRAPVSPNRPCAYLLGPSLQLAQVPRLVASLSRPSHLQNAGNSASSQSHISWLSLTQTDVQKYTNNFVKVDAYRWEDHWCTNPRTDGRPRGSPIFFLFIFWLVFYRHRCHICAY